MKPGSERYASDFRAKRVIIPSGKRDKRKFTFAAFYLSCQNRILSLSADLLFGENDHPRKILVFRTGSLGDSICATPSLAAIRKHYSDSHITLLTNTGSQNLVGPEKVIGKHLYDDIIDYFEVSPMKLLRLLRQKKFDMIIQLPQVDSGFLRLLRDLIYFRFVARSGWGWELSRSAFHKKLLEKHVFYYNESDRLLNILTKNRINKYSRSFNLNITEDDEEIIKDFITKNNLTDKLVISIAVGANSTKNRWPIDYFDKVITHLSKRYTILLIGGPDDIDLVKRFGDKEGVFNCCGIFTPMQSAVLIRHSLVAICNDSGPLHLSYAVGTPVIGLFASRDFYGKWFPPEDTSHIVFRTPDVSCSLCFFSECANNICMQAIKPDMVITAVEDLINKE